MRISKILITSIFIVFMRVSLWGKDYISCKPWGQLGNQLFLISTTLGLAWDNGAIPVFPDLKTEQNWNVNFNLKNIFFRLNTVAPKHVTFKDTKLDFYKKVNYQKNLRLTGFDVRLNYFGHYQGQLQKIFSPSQEVEALIKNKYGNLLNAPNNVGIQIRVCANNTVPFSGWDYYLSAMKLFSQKSLFIICSDRISWVKKHFPIKGENIIFIDDSDHYLIDFYLLTKCKNLVVGASTFGFWAAFLNENPQKKVVVPSLWLSHHDKRTLEGFPHKWNVYPKDWIVLPVPLVRMVPKDILQYSTISCDW